MKINRDNYEAYFLDYHEGQLSPEMAEEVLAFVELNPDLKNIFFDFEAVSLEADESIVFANKSSLKKNEMFADTEVNELNCEDFMLRETEGLLTKQEIKSLDAFISRNPQCEADRKLFKLAHLSPENEIVFESKEQLKKKAIPVGAITADTYETYLARELEGDLNQGEQLALAEFMQYNPHLEKERQLYTHTILKADEDIVFENKGSLKRSVIPLRRIAYYALSAAASIALIFSIYFLLDVNKVPQNIAQQGNVKNTIENSTNPLTQIPGEVEVKSNPATTVAEAAVANNYTPAKPGVASEKLSVDTHSPNQLAIAERHSITLLGSKSVRVIKTKQFVDPQFTFIRSSQMVMNQNREFYYNLKLAEEIQYAELNAEDKNPGRTILNAASQKVGELFAFNRNKPEPRDENKNISLWTFAQLGVQTINTVTSGELELKLKKDDEGKVIAYGFENGIVDFEKELKK